jgi:hypothetical protein
MAPKSEHSSIRKFVKSNSQAKFTLTGSEVQPRLAIPSANRDVHFLTRIGDKNSLCDGYNLDLEIYLFMLETESTQILPSPRLFDTQSSILPAMRETLVDWLIGIHRKFCACPETLYTTIYLMDLYLSKVDLDKTSYQRLACACLVIAAKAEESAPVRLQELVFLADNSFSVPLLRDMEASVFRTVGCHVHPVLSIHFLNRFLLLVKADEQLRRHCSYLSESLLMWADFIGVRPSFVASCVLRIGLQIVRSQSWDGKLQIETGYSAANMAEAVNVMLGTVTELANHPNFAIQRKYPEISPNFPDAMPE